MLEEVELAADQTIALVLSGGGARGSYQIGVWKAMVELGMTIDIVTGISVGALNGAFVMQGDLKEAEDMWLSIVTSDVLDYEIDDIDSFSDYTKHLSSLVIQAFKQGGIDTSPLRELMEFYLDDEAKLHASEVEFGVAVTNSETWEVETYFINDLPREQIKKLLVASASLFPILEKTTIDDQDYMDGGYRNHVPLSLAQEKTPDFLVIVDLMPEKQVKLDFKNTQGITLQSAWPLGDMLLFDKHRSKRNMTLGYNDFMKGIGKYQGHLYTFSDQGQRLYHFIQDHLDKNSSSPLFKLIEDNQDKIKDKLEEKWGKTITSDNIHLALLELAGRIFLLKPEPIRRVDDYTALLLQKVRELYNMDEKSSTKTPTSGFYLGYREWYHYFSRRFAIMPEQDRIFRFIKLMQSGKDDLSQLSQQITFKLDPIMYLIAYFIYIISGN